MKLRKPFREHGNVAGSDLEQPVTTERAPDALELRRLLPRDFVEVRIGPIEDLSVIHATGKTIRVTRFVSLW